MDKEIEEERSKRGWDRLIQLLFGLTLTLCSVTTLPAYALPLLDSPTASDLAGPVFIQPFAGLAVVSETAGVGRTEPFFSDLPDNSLPGNRVVNILGNFQAFDPFGIPTPFEILGVEVTDGGATFTPAFGEFDFAGNPSLTFFDSVDFDVVTLFDGDFTLAFSFISDAALDYEFALLTDLPVGSFFLFDDVETSVPEPATWFLIVPGLVGLFGGRQHRRG